MMRLLAPALFALATAPAGASEGYELRLIDKEGQRTIAVSGGENRLAVARGDEDLKVLDTNAALATWAETGASLDAEEDKLEWTEGDKLTIHKSESDADAKDGKKKKVEKRVIVRKGENGESEIEIDGDRDAIIVEEIGKDGLAFIDKDAPDGDRRVIRIEKKKTKDGESEKNHRVIRILGASAESARRFIDEAKGLDAAERTAMKAAAGL
jgi:hypothetical protein